MKNSMKCLSIIMVMIMMMLAACAQENTSDSGESAKTGIVGKWKDTSDGSIWEFKSNGTADIPGTNISSAEWTGNDEAGRVVMNFRDDGGYASFSYHVTGYNLTITSEDYGVMEQYNFTRM